MINPNIAILISGYGKNMEAIIQSSKNNDLKAIIKIVIANKDCIGIHTAKELGFKTLVKSLLNTGITKVLIFILPYFLCFQD